MRIKSKLFSIKARTKATAICSLVAIIATLAVSFPTQAQVDPGFHEIFQMDFTLIEYRQRFAQ